VRWASTYKAFDINLRCPVTLKIIIEPHGPTAETRLTCQENDRISD
jgi:hypothetical protein